MSDTGDDGHCKDAAHVRVLATASPENDSMVFGAVYVPQTTCVNVPGYSGWVVQLTAQLPPHPVRPGLRLLPELAEVFPAWLRRARRQAIESGVNVVIEHTFDKVWVTWDVLSPDQARRLARSVLRAVEQAPPGVNG